MVNNGCGQLMIPLITPGDEARRYRGKLQNRKNKAEYTFVVKEKMQEVGPSGELVFTTNERGEPVFVQCARGNSVFFKQHKHGPHRNWELREDFARKQRQALLKTTAKWNKEAKEMEVKAKLEKESGEDADGAKGGGGDMAGDREALAPRPRKRKKKQWRRPVHAPFRTNFMLADSVPADVRKAVILAKVRGKSSVISDLNHRPHTPPPPTTRAGKLRLALQVKLQQHGLLAPRTKAVHIQVLHSEEGDSQDAAPAPVPGAQTPKLLRADAGMGGAHAGGVGFKGRTIGEGMHVSSDHVFRDHTTQRPSRSRSTARRAVPPSGRGKISNV
jgi:hypothetical protein